MFALNFLGVLLAHLMLLGIEMPLVGPPAICIKRRDAKRCQQLLEGIVKLLQKTIRMCSNKKTIETVASTPGCPQQTFIV